MRFLLLTIFGYVRVILEEKFLFVFPPLEDLASYKPISYKKTYLLL